MWTTPLVILICLAICNRFPAPPPLIKAKNHNRILMKDAVDSLRSSAAPGSIIFADYQSGLLLSYYVCGHGVVQVFPPYPAFARDECGAYTAITPRPQEWKFYASDLPGRLESVAHAYNLAPGTKLWLFDAGWITDSTPALRKQLPQLGCTEPHSFGENILLCEINGSK